MTIRSPERTERQDPQAQVLHGRQEAVFAKEVSSSMRIEWWVVYVMGE